MATIGSQAELSAKDTLVPNSLRHANSSFTSPSHFLTSSLPGVQFGRSTICLVHGYINMAQGKGKAVKGGPAQRHLYSRISYLYQAATYLAENASKRRNDHANLQGGMRRKSEKVGSPSSVATSESHSEEAPRIQVAAGDGQAAGTRDATSRSYLAVSSPQLLAHLRAVSRKSQIRLAPDLKRSICKRCDALLVPGSTSTNHLENKSRNGSKPWADVLVVTCIACQAAKRYPVGAKRQPKRQKRP